MVVVVVDVEIVVVVVGGGGGVTLVTLGMPRVASFVGPRGSRCTYATLSAKCSQVGFSSRREKEEAQK